MANKQEVLKRIADYVQAQISDALKAFSKAPGADLKYLAEIDTEASVDQTYVKLLEVIDPVDKYQELRTIVDLNLGCFAAEELSDPHKWPSQKEMVEWLIGFESSIKRFDERIATSSKR